MVRPAMVFERLDLARPNLVKHRVTIRTIQRLYCMLCGEELEEDFDEKSGFEIAAADQRPKDVVYNPRA
jgi:hypothetical protein